MRNTTAKLCSVVNNMLSYMNPLRLSADKTLLGEMGLAAIPVRAAENQTVILLVCSLRCAEARRVFGEDDGIVGFS